MLVIDVVDQEARFPVAYSWQPVRGWAVKHYDIILGQSSQRVKENALAEGPWDACEKLWADAFEIPSEDFVFHPGGPDDIPDALFPDEPPHPWTAYMHAKCRAGLTDDQTDNLFGIYRTLKTPDFDGNGNQLNSVGGIVTPSDPRTEYFFKPNPANCVADQLLRWGKRLPDIINFPAWVDWRDYNDEFISWDNSKYSPRNLSLTPTSGGSLTPGTTYISRVVTLRGADISSASRKSVEHPSNQIALQGGQTAFQVNWLISGDENNPSTVPGDISSFRVYVGSVIGGVETWAGYFDVSDPAARTLLVTTLSGVTAGEPPNMATSGLLVNIRRFECGLFSLPPYDLGTMLDRICQISCADWQWSGLGTGTYRNDKLRFMSPANRSSVFTLNQAEIAPGSFKTYPVDRRTRPNQIVVNFRDRDDPYLGPGQPVVLPREQLQEDEGQIKVFSIDGGTMYRSQAQRCASFYARVLCDMDQMAAMVMSPKTYGFLPGDVMGITNDTPDWTDQKFIARKKEEECEESIGDSILLQLYTDDLYSDTDFSPLPNPLPRQRIDPFAAPPTIVSLTLSEVDTASITSIPQINIHGVIQAANFPGTQSLRVFLKGPGDSDFQPTGIILSPDPITMQAVFDIPVLSTEPFPWAFSVKVTSESLLGNTSGFVSEDIFVTGPPPPGVPTNFQGFYGTLATGGELLNEWVPGQEYAVDKWEAYEYEVRNAGDTATIFGPVEIRPALNRQLQEFIVYDPDSYVPHTSPYDEFFLQPRGGITLHNTTALMSKASAEIVGGLLAWWQIPRKDYVPEVGLGFWPMAQYVGLLPEDEYPFSPVFFWQTVSEEGVPIVIYPEGFFGGGHEAYKRNVIPGDIVSVYIRPDGIGEYYIGFPSESNSPIFVSGKAVDLTKKWKAVVIGNGCVQQSMWQRQGPEFLLNAEAQDRIYGVGVRPNVVARVRQLNPYPSGLPSPWVTQTFVR